MIMIVITIITMMITTIMITVTIIVITNILLLLIIIITIIIIILIITMVITAVVIIIIIAINHYCCDYNSYLYILVSLLSLLLFGLWSLWVWCVMICAISTLLFAGHSLKIGIKPRWHCQFGQERLWLDAFPCSSWLVLGSSWQGTRIPLILMLCMIGPWSDCLSSWVEGLLLTLWIGSVDLHNKRKLKLHKQKTNHREIESFTYPQDLALREYILLLTSGCQADSCSHMYSSWSWKLHSSRRLSDQTISNSIDFFPLLLEEHPNVRTSYLITSDILSDIWLPDLASTRGNRLSS